MFGEIEVIKVSQRRNQAIAVEDSLVASIPCNDFKCFLGRMPQLSGRLNRIMCLRLSRIEDTLSNIAYREVPTRLVAFFSNI